MRTFLHKLMVDLTRHPREVITPVWSTSIVVNTFRVYEYWFGRRAGIRFEGAKSPYADLYVHGTWENFLAHQEGRLRALKNPFAFKLVPLRVFVTPDGQTFKENSIFNFAIAYDNSAEASTTSGTTISGSFTVTGSNPIVMSWSGGGTGASSDVTSGSYNGVATALATNVKIPSDRWWDCWFLAGAATGSHTISITGTTANLWIGGLSYSGAAQSGQLDNTNTTSVSGNATLSGSITVNTANSWVAFLTSTRGFTITSASGVSPRLNIGDMQMCDNNAPLTTGSFSCSITIGSGSFSQGGVLVSIKPVASAAVVNSGFFFAAAS